MGAGVGASGRGKLCVHSGQGDEQRDRPRTQYEKGRCRLFAILCALVPPSQQSSQLLQYLQVSVVASCLGGGGALHRRRTDFRAVWQFDQLVIRMKRPFERCHLLQLLKQRTYSIIYPDYEMWDLKGR
jgi:hypothetical protein